MVKKNKTLIVREISEGEGLEMPFNHPLEYHSWKSAVSYCNTTYGYEDQKRYSIKKNTANGTFIVSAEKLKSENVEC